MLSVSKMLSVTQRLLSTRDDSVKDWSSSLRSRRIYMPRGKQRPQPQKRQMTAILRLPMGMS